MNESHEQNDGVADHPFASPQSPGSQALRKIGLVVNITSALDEVIYLPPPQACLHVARVVADAVKRSKRAEAIVLETGVLSMLRAMVVGEGGRKGGAILVRGDDSLPAARPSGMAAQA